MAPQLVAPQLGDRVRRDPLIGPVAERIAFLNRSAAIVQRISRRSRAGSDRPSFPPVHARIVCGRRHRLRPQDATRADLVWTLRCAAAGQRVVCLGTMEMLARIWLVGNSAKTSHRKTLSLDEEVILRLIELGVPTRQIAADLHRGMRAVGKLTCSSAEQHSPSIRAGRYSRRI
jgi:hypothetical protein